MLKIRMLWLISLGLATPGHASPCAARFERVERVFDFQNVVPRDQLIWRGRRGAALDHDREMRPKDPPLLDVAISPNGRRALATFRTGEIVLFGDFEPKLLFAIAPTDDIASEFVIHAARQVAWFDDENIAIMTGVRDVETRVERLVVSRGRIDANNDYVPLGDLSLPFGTRVAVLETGVLAKSARAREMSFVPRGHGLRDQRRIPLERIEEPLLAVTPSRRRVLLLDWFVTRRIARLFAWNSRGRGAPEPLVDFGDHLDPKVNVPEVKAARAVGERLLALSLENNTAGVSSHALFVYGKRLVRQKLFAPTEQLLAVSNLGRFAVTLDRTARPDRQAWPINLWAARGRTFEPLTTLGSANAEVSRVEMTENPRRLWIFTTGGTLRLIDLPDSNRVQ